MARSDAVRVAEKSTIELHNYLKNPDKSPEAEFDDFLGDVEVLFRLRLEAENNFANNQHLAKNKLLELPLDWPDIQRILEPVTDIPPEEITTQIARLCVLELENVINNMHKVLIRQREKVPIGNVQQLDPHCLRWLTRQPGRTATEKAGGRQHILAVVRRENYDTLENRVLKDLIMRIHRPCSEYLKVNKVKFKDHSIIRLVRRLFSICNEANYNPIFEIISPLSSFPIPNYVLQQGLNYNKIWKAYCLVIRQSVIAERLWLRRHELHSTLMRLKDELPRQTNPCAVYHCPIWFNNIDGKKDFLDAPFYENQNGSLPQAEKTHVDTDKNFILDIIGNHEYNLLIYSQHKNANPYIQNYNRPSIEDILDIKRHNFLEDILNEIKQISKGDVESCNNSTDESPYRAIKILKDYFRQVQAKFDGSRWIILIPDDWDAQTQEIIIKCAPLPRSNIFLLWRSVAIAINSIKTLNSIKEADLISIIDIHQSGSIEISKLIISRGENGDLIPQRKSYARSKNSYAHFSCTLGKPIDYKEKFLHGRRPVYTITEFEKMQIQRFVANSQHIICMTSVEPEKCGLRIPTSNFYLKNQFDLINGAKEFIAKNDKGEIAYYDELEALSLIVQGQDEQIKDKRIVEPNEKSPGGKEITLDIIKDAATVEKHSNFVELFLCMGEVTTNTPLKKKRHTFAQTLAEDHTIDLIAKITPGQGMAIVSVMSDFLREPIELDWLNGMSHKDEGGNIFTKNLLENKIPRSFPPNSPDVIADYDMWINIERQVKHYMQGRIPPDGSWFANARRLYDKMNPLPHNKHPFERLRRKNIFGNDPAHRFPVPYQPKLFDTPFNFKALFNKLASDYKNPLYAEYRKQLTRLIAWTYQSNLPEFVNIRGQVLKKIIKYAEDGLSAPLFQEYTLCANLCYSADEWHHCLLAVFRRIKNYNNNVLRDFYLLYNLLQFHPTIIYDVVMNSRIKVDLGQFCWKFVEHFPYWMEYYRNSKVAIGYILKSLLYFLRCRRFDGKKFLTKKNDHSQYKIISDCLNIKVHESQEQLRKLVIEYLNGRGTIEGLPVD